MAEGEGVEKQVVQQAKAAARSLPLVHSTLVLALAPVLAVLHGERGKGWIELAVGSSFVEQVRRVQEVPEVQVQEVPVQEAEVPAAPIRTMVDVEA